MCDVDVPIHLHSNQMSVFAFFRFQRTNNDGGPNRFSIVLLGARTTVSFRLKSLLKFAFVMPCPFQALEKNICQSDVKTLFLNIYILNFERGETREPNFSGRFNY